MNYDTLVTALILLSVIAIQAWTHRDERRGWDIERTLLVNKVIAKHTRDLAALQAADRPSLNKHVAPPAAPGEPPPPAQPWGLDGS